MNNALIKFNSKDMIMVKLAHYFITQKDYNPIILHGINDEIWLENLDENYRVVRIVGHYIHNNEQLNFDKFKVNRILKSIKRKTLSLKIDIVNIYIDLGDNVLLEENINNSLNFFVGKISDLKNPTIMQIFPDIIEKTIPIIIPIITAKKAIMIVLNKPSNIYK